MTKRRFTRFTSKTSNSDLKPDQNIGLFITKSLDSFLNLYAASQRISKSAVIRDILMSWHIETEPDIEKILADLLFYIQYEWQLAKTLNKTKLEDPITFEDFEEDIKSTLKKKGISEKIIDQLLNRLII